MMMMMTMDKADKRIFFGFDIKGVCGDEDTICRVVKGCRW
jgi:hypothetical protein